MNINGRMKVKTLKSQFKDEFSLTLRVYDGRSFADDDSTLAAIRKGDSKGGEFTPRKNTKVGNLEDKFQEMFGIKVQISGSDDSYLCDNDLTLQGASEKDFKKLERKQQKDEKESENIDSNCEQQSNSKLKYIVDVGYGNIDEVDSFEKLDLIRFVVLAKDIDEDGESSYYAIKLFTGSSSLYGIYEFEKVIHDSDEWPWQTIGKYLEKVDAFGRSAELLIGTIQCSMEADNDGLEQLAEDEGFEYYLDEGVPELSEDFDGKIFAIAYHLDLLVDGIDQFSYEYAQKLIDNRDYDELFTTISY